MRKKQLKRRVETLGVLKLKNQSFFCVDWDDFNMVGIWNNKSSASKLLLYNQNKTVHPNSFYTLILQKKNGASEGGSLQCWRFFLVPRLQNVCCSSVWSCRCATQQPNSKAATRVGWFITGWPLTNPQNVRCKMTTIFSESWHTYKLSFSTSLYCWQMDMPKWGCWLLPLEVCSEEDLMNSWWPLTPNHFVCVCPLKKSELLGCANSRR